MDLVTKFQSNEKKLVEYDSDSNSENLHEIRVFNIPYESNSDGPSEDIIQKRINNLPDEIKTKISGYSIKKDAARLVRTNIAQIRSYEAQ